MPKDLVPPPIVDDDARPDLRSGQYLNEAARDAYNLLRDRLQDDHLLSMAVALMTTHEVLTKGNHVQVTYICVGDDMVRHR